MANNWKDISAFNAVPAEDVISMHADGRELALYKVESRVYATDNVCTHGRARLCDGFLDGFEIECPLHQGRFDIRDGRPLCEPAVAPVRAYPVKIENGRVFVDLG
jgi:naphthalene 1,2-dioxygenase system ferredoxin subunit